MSIDKSNLSKVIYTHTKHGQINTLAQNHVFEKDVPHEIQGLEGVNFTNLELRDYLKRTNQYNDLFKMNRDGVATSSQDIYPTIASSQLYFLLLNFVKIPTKIQTSVEKTKLYVCRLEFKEPSEMNSDNLDAYNFLGFIGALDGQDIVLEESVYNYLVENHANVIDINEKTSIQINYKKATLVKIENPNDVVCLTHQNSYKTRCKEILYYKALNEVTAEDNSRLDNLQYHMIDQQLRFGMYLALKPVLQQTYLKFNRQKSLFDQTGNLFFSLSLPVKSPNKTDVLEFSDVVMQIMDYGFYISYLNIDGKVTFSKENTIEAAKQFQNPNFTQRENSADILGRNEMYTLLFRLLDSNMLDTLEKIDDLILNKKYDEFYEEVIKTI